MLLATPLGADSPDPTQDPVLRRTVAAITELHPISASCTRVIDVSSDRRSSVDNLVSVMDPAMTTRLMRLANSAHYGHFRGVDSVHDAVLLLGFGTVRGIALSVCAAQSFGAVANRFDTQKFWFFAVSVAHLTQVVTTAYHRHVEQAFTAGILHGIGRLALAQFHPDELDQARVRAETGKTSLAETQLELLGFTDAQLGAGLAEAWDFPADLCQAIAGQQLSAEETQHDEGLAADLARARRYARAYGLTDGIEPRERRLPDPEWSAAPLLPALRAVGAMPGLRLRTDTFIEHALGMPPAARAA